MARNSYRLLLVTAALAVAAAGILSIFLGHSRGAAAQSGPLVIEASESGFNPSLCIVSRDDVVAWKNIGTTVRRVIVPDAGVGSPPLFDTGDIAPGTTSGPVEITYGGTMHYQDFYDPSLKGTIQAPQFANSGPVNCSPQAPTPVPTPTAQPTQAPKPPRCLTSVGCAVAPAVSRDQQ